MNGYAKLSFGHVGAACSTMVVAMVSVDQGLVREALGTLKVEDKGELAVGGQKVVRLVEGSEGTQVLKVIAIGSSQPEALRRAEREVDLLARISNPHVVQVESSLIELGSPVRGAAWLEEYLDGEDLNTILDGNAWSWDDVARLGYEVSLGIGAGHAVGVVHRDLSDRNIRRLASGTYKVMDFGFARHTLRSGITIGGHPGTTGFLSPEHIHGYSGGPTPASDVFVLGAHMYKALTGVAPISTDDEYDYVIHLMSVSVVEDIAQVRPDLTAEQCEIIRKCMHPQSARRFRNGRRLADALEVLL